MPELEERQARIEGTLEQLEKRIGRVEVQLDELRKQLDEFRKEFRTELIRLEGKIDTNFRWTVGLWVTTILAIIGLYLKV